MSIIERLIRIIAPHHCVGCGEEGPLLCNNCAALLPRSAACCYRCGALDAVQGICAGCRAVTPLFGVYAVSAYSGIAKVAVHRLKFERAQAAANDIAAVMTRRFDVPALGDAVTYVPTAPARIRLRGYDQAALIAQAVARQCNLPCRALLGRKNNQRQLGQTRTKRRQQMAQTFYARDVSQIRGQRLILIDDVFTTGATCDAAAAVLREAGAVRTAALVFALAPRPGEIKKPPTAEAI